MIKITSAEFLQGVADLRQLPKRELKEVLFIGRSNVGKSSLLNKLCGRKNLARSSSTPGKTREINYYIVNDHFYFVDLPGYGYAKVPAAVREQWGRLMEDYFQYRQVLAGLVLVMDIRHPLTEFDQRMLAWCEPLGLPVLVLLTKADKLTRNHANQARQAVSRQLAELPVQVEVFSAVSGQGVEAAREVIDRWLTA